MRTIKLCSVVFGIVVHAAGAVMNKIHCCVAVCVVNEDPHLVLSTTAWSTVKLLIALHQSSIREPDSGRESRFMPTPTALDAPVREIRVGILP